MKIVGKMAVIVIVMAIVKTSNTQQRFRIINDESSKRPILVLLIGTVGHWKKYSKSNYKNTLSPPIQSSNNSGNTSDNDSKSDNTPNITSYSNHTESISI